MLDQGGAWRVDTGAALDSGGGSGAGPADQWLVGRKGQCVTGRFVGLKPAVGVAAAAGVVAAVGVGVVVAVHGDEGGGSADVGVVSPLPRHAPAAGVEAGGEAARARQQRAVAEGVRSRTVEVAASRLPEHPDAGQSGQCLASMYGDPQPTASGEIFDPTQLTAAHPTLPFHTMVEVTNTATGRSVTVRINDRGPYVAGRCLDLSTAAFSAIASLDQGVVRVSWRVVG